MAKEHLIESAAPTSKDEQIDLLRKMLLGRRFE